jgi:glyceraldehyde 3-phosphate dehydrogenase
MATRIAINGFGRIGRLTARILLTKFPEVEIIAINDLTEAKNLAYLFKYDSTYRTFEKEVTSTDNSIKIGQREIQVFSEKDPSKLPWKDLNIDLVIESTGIFRTSEGAQLHLDAGAKKVLISAPGKSDGIETVLLGVKDPTEDSTIYSNASCTTNCVAPAYMVVDKNFDLVKSFGLTAHAYTASQSIQDGPSKKAYRDGRAAFANAIPSTTGAAKAVFEVLPQLQGKIELSALRIPVITGSMVYITAQLEKEVSVEEFNAKFQEASQTYLKGILEYSEDELVSSDVIGNPHSTVFDANLTEVNGDTVKFVVWYDNEWGYSNRLAEVAVQL